MSKKKVNERRKILDRSLEWIRQNPHATNLDVPLELIDDWVLDDDDDEAGSEGFFFTVFTFGYLQYELSSRPPTSQSLSVPSSRLVECFSRWQLKLALAEIHHRTSVKVAPMPLFRFPDGEDITYWPRREQA